MFLLPLLLGGDDGLGGFAEPGLVVEGPDGITPDALHRDIPQDYLDAYLEAAARFGVPWPVLAAVGKATTDHGRFSPYDDGCPQRDPLRNAERARQYLVARAAEAGEAKVDAERRLAAAEADLGSGEGSTTSQAVYVAAEREVSRLSAAALDIDDRLADLALAVEMLGTSHRPCLIDRDHFRPYNLPPGSELLVVPAWDFHTQGERAGEPILAPDRHRFDVLWGRWVRRWDDGLDGEGLDVFGPKDLEPDERAPFDGPMMLSAGVITDPNRDRSSLVDSVMALAAEVEDARIALEGSLGSSLVSWQVDAAAADSVWGQVADLLPILTLLEDPESACPVFPSAPVDALVETIWRCELASMPLNVIYDAVVNDGQVVSYRNVPAAAAVETLVGEAILVAAGFSGLGSASCDQEAELAGVFPLTRAQAAAAGISRCDPVGNITAAARIVAAGEIVQPALRGGSRPYAALAGGWGQLAGALGSSGTYDSFAETGPAQAALSSPACLQEARDWAVGMLSDPASPVTAAWLSGQPSDAVEQLATWGGFGFDGGACAPLSDPVAQGLARRAVAEFDTDRMYSYGIADVPPDLLALRASLAAAALQRSGLPAAVWGRDSFVPRLSSSVLAWPGGDRTSSSSARPGLELAYFAVPMAVRYGGTVPEDERVGTWLLAPGVLWAASTALLSSEDIESLVAALDALGGDPDRVSAVALAEEAGVPLAAAARFLSSYRELSEDLSRPPTARELFDLIYTAPTVGANGLACPVDGARPSRNPGFINDWHFCRGDPPCSRLHQGNDIFAPTGTPIRAVDDAEVVRVRCRGCGSRGAGWGDYSPLGGVSVTYRTANGWSWYNAHMDTIAPGIVPGARVAKNAVIGTVGWTGNASRSSPHNHLGLYIDGVAVNPFPVTSVACGS